MLARTLPLHKLENDREVFRNPKSRNGTLVRLINATPHVGYKLCLEYDDGVVGEVDLSALVGKGVFAAWSDATVFEAVTVGEHGEVRWTEDLELCADALYLQITGKSAEDLFPNLRSHADA